MQLPNNFEAFKTIVIEKVKTYCDTNIWPFSFEQLAAWLGNFDCVKEEYIALQILDSLIVRSNSMAKASYARLLHSSVRQFLLENTSINVGSIPKWKQKLSSGSLSNELRFCPIKLENDQGESGSVIFRMLSSEINTDRYSLAKAKQSPEVIILIDDFIGSGKQFDDFAKQTNLTSMFDSSIILYCPLIAFEVGIDFLKSNYSKLHVLPAEIIYCSDSLFYGESNGSFKNDQQNTVGEIELFYDLMHKKYAPKMKNWFGFEQACLPLVFEWGCPNQSPSLLYMNNSIYKNNWQQLFNRRS